MLPEDVRLKIGGVDKTLTEVRKHLQQSNAQVQMGLVVDGEESETIGVVRHTYAGYFSIRLEPREGYQAVRLGSGSENALDRCYRDLYFRLHGQMPTPVVCKGRFVPDRVARR